MTRAGMAVMCGPAFVLSVFVGITQGNPLAWGLAIGFAAPIVGTALLLGATRPKSLPRKADPAKIARLEVDLQTGPAWDEFKRQQAHRERVAKMAAGPREGATAWEGDRLLVYRDGHWTQAQANVVDTEAIPTTAHQFLGVKPPAERNVEDCPRPEGCVIAHPCRKCGADRGQACVGDPYAEHTADAQRIVTFHGAPTFGHKIAKPSGPPRKPSDARRSARP